LWDSVATGSTITRQFSGRVKTWRDRRIKGPGRRRKEVFSSRGDLVEAESLKRTNQRQIHWQFLFLRSLVDESGKVGLREIGGRTPKKKGAKFTISGEKNESGKGMCCSQCKRRLLNERPFPQINENQGDGTAWGGRRGGSPKREPSDYS